ncbi:MAG: OmpA family protein [Oscillatoriales cyanobacterium RM2_1_1]|nr:OmpA family protein [Oscillatoriales cyanobacterium SM2_3_0]NJO47452.1 OmpA family protein [Oscillatoriales cyanobacterium RM2_1_1]
MTQSIKPQPQPQKKPQGNSTLMVLSILLNFLLLTLGSGVAWILGMAIAQINPHPNPQPPWIEKFFQRSPIAALGRSPQTLTVKNPSPSPPPTTSPKIPLSGEKRQEIQSQLQQLQQDFNTLIGRTAALELQLGISRPDEPLEERLQSMDQQLIAETSGSIADAATTTSVATDGAQTATPQPVDVSRELIVTLPSDILFESGSNALRPGANVILDNLIGDLRVYPQAAIRVAGHSNSLSQPQENLSLSLQQAEAVMGYLARAVGEGYRWMAIGYGESRPSVENTSEANQQLNRRIEVAISP